VHLPRSFSVYFLKFIKSSTLKVSVCGFVILGAGVSCSNEQGALVAGKTKLNAIIGGQAAQSNDAITRSTVAMVSAKNDILKEQCTGTLVAPNLVLTAAHCLEGLRPLNVWIHFGEVLPRPFYLNQLTQVKNFIVHPQFGPVYDSEFPATELNDIALIVLKTDAPAGFVPVLIQDGTSPTVGEQLLLAGYGHTSDVNPIRAKGLNYARVQVSRLWQSLIVLDQTNKSGACNGDSGGPAYRETENGLVVVGITRGAHNKSPNCHGFVEYTNTTFFKSFLIEAARDLDTEPPQFTN
jgi:secreted trypsin-like serine protease